MEENIGNTVIDSSYTGELKGHYRPPAIALATQIRSKVSELNELLKQAAADKIKVIIFAKNNLNEAEILRIDLLAQTL